MGGTSGDSSSNESEEPENSGDVETDAEKAARKKAKKKFWKFQKYLSLAWDWWWLIIVWSSAVTRISFDCDGPNFSIVVIIDDDDDDDDDDDNVTGFETKFFSREPSCIFKCYLEMLCIETSTSLGSLQKFEGAAGEFKGALGSWHPLISSPGGWWWWSWTWPCSVEPHFYLYKILPFWP